MITIELTDEQQQALQAEPKKRIDVLNPATQQFYVLLALDQYERVRALLEGSPEPSPQSGQSTASASGPEGQPQRILLRDLPTPPEVAQEAKRYCKKLGLWSRKYIQQTEDHLKLQYYYGGQPIYVVRTPEGPVVVPIEERYRNTPDLRYVLLTPGERSHACHDVPSRWHDTISEILM